MFEEPYTVNSTEKIEHIECMLNKTALFFSEISKSPKLIDCLKKSSDLIAQKYGSGGCLYVAGNGGSASDSQHLVAELVSKLNKDRTPIKAIALTVNSSILTAIGNDYGYDKVFSRQVDALMSDKDIFLAFSTSGNSPNIIEALNLCKKKSISSILFSGSSGGDAAALATVNVLLPSTSTPMIQEGHLVLYHLLCDLIEKDLVRQNLCKYL